MKIQDIGFIVVFLALLLLKKPRYLLITGLVSFVFAIPLFSQWIFFTAERLTWYGAGFILTYILYFLT